MQGDIKERGKNGFAALTKARLLQDTFGMKMNLNGENTDFSSPPPAFRESAAWISEQAQCQGKEKKKHSLNFFN